MTRIFSGFYKHDITGGTVCVHEDTVSNTFFGTTHNSADVVLYMSLPAFCVEFVEISCQVLEHS